MQVIIECEGRKETNDFRIAISVPENQWEFEESIPASRFAEFIAGFSDSPIFRMGFITQGTMAAVVSMMEKEYALFCQAASTNE